MKELEADVNFLNTDPYLVDSAVRKYTDIDYTYKEISLRSKMTACHPAAHNISSLEMYDKKAYGFVNDRHTLFT